MRDVTRYTVDDWIALDDTGSRNVRYELVDGVFHAMTSGSRRHGAAILAIGSIMHPAAIRDGCRAYVSDVRLQVGDDGYFPDLMVVCSDPVDDLVEIDPCLVIEVLSRSTQRIDRTDKLAAYSTIEALRAYLVLNPDFRQIEIHRRTASEWEHFTVGTGDEIALTCPEITIDVDDLYRTIDVGTN